MTDRELLEAAAKAAGHDWQWFGEHFHVRGDVDERLFLKWRPLTDDGDALRLAVALRISVQATFDSGEVSASWRANKIFAGNTVEEIGSLRNGNEPAAAIRRAIVRAAAAMAVG